MNIEYAKNMQARNETNEDDKYGALHEGLSYESPLNFPTPLNDSSNESKKLQGDGELTIIVRKQPPLHLFPKQEFEFDYSLVRTDGTGGNVPQKYTRDLKDLEINATLLQSEVKIGSRIITKPIVSENGSIIILAHRQDSSGLNGTLLCRIDFSEETQRKEKVNNEITYCVRINSTGSLGETVVTFGHALTRNISIAPYKLVVTKTSSWENVWFKDEGGRDKCVEVLVHAQDEKDQLLFESIQLKLTLCYDVNKKLTTGEPTPVNNQDILRVLGRTISRQHIDQDTGKAKIRFRIEDVSKNHQGQNFVLKIAAEGFWNISPVHTSPITIRSKRSKLNRRGTGNLTGGSDHSNVSAMLTSSPGVSLPWRGTAFPLAENDDRKQSSPLFDSFDPVRLQQAYSGVVQWVDEVVAGIYPLQWQVVGYAQHPDGSPDYSRPYHNMPSPNAFINRILSAYNDSTRMHLRLIGDAIEQHASKVRSPVSPQQGSFDRENSGYPGYDTVGRPPTGFPQLPFEFQQQSQQHPPHLQQVMSPRMVMTVNKPAAPPLQYPQRDMRDSVYPTESFPRQQQQYTPNLPYQRLGTSPQRHIAHSLIDNRSKTHALYEGYSNPPEELANKRMKMSSADQPFASHTQNASQVQSPGRLGEYEISREHEVEFILAKNHKSSRTGERLGFPAYSNRKEIVGFYRSSSGVDSGAPLKFVSIGQQFGPAEKLQATDILNEDIASNSESVHRLQDWGSIGHMLNHCIVYEWSRELGDESGTIGEKSTGLN